MLQHPVLTYLRLFALTYFTPPKSQTICSCLLKKLTQPSQKLNESTHGEGHGGLWGQEVVTWDGSRSLLRERERRGEKVEEDARREALNALHKVQHADCTEDVEVDRIPLYERARRIMRCTCPVRNPYQAPALLFFSTLFPFLCINALSSYQAFNSCLQNLHQQLWPNIYSSFSLSRSIFSLLPSVFPFPSPSFSDQPISLQTRPTHALTINRGSNSLFEAKKKHRQYQKKNISLRFLFQYRL